jgi:hypothetical protein
MNVGVLFCPVLSNIQKSIAFLKVPSLLRLFPLVRVVLRRICVRSIGVMILKEEDKRYTNRKQQRIMHRKNQPKAFFSVSLGIGLRSSCVEENN